MATSIKDHLIDDCLFDKLNSGNQANGKIFRPWDCAMNEAAKSIKSSQFLKENSLSLTNSSTVGKSNVQPRLPNDYLTEMFNTSCTMNQNSLTAMETIYNHFYRDYLTNKSKNENTISNDLLNTFTGKLNANKLASCSLKNTIDLIPNKLASLTDNLISSTKQLNTKLSAKFTAETLPSNQLPVNKDAKCEAASNQFLTNEKSNQSQKKPRPKRFRCPYCDDAQFSNNGQLKGHIRTHTGK